VAITAFLEVRVKPEALDQGFHAELHSILSDTRAFEGCLGVDVLIDTADPTHLVAVERWASEEHDAAYRAWRAGAGKTNLASFLVSPPILTKFTSADEV
jgi:quinol monooxygenase YgiN